MERCSANLSTACDAGVDLDRIVARRYPDMTLDGFQLRRALGLRPETPNAARWDTAIEELSRTLPALARPRAVFRIEPVRTLADRRLELRSGAAFDGAVGQFLSGSRFVALFVATIGSAVERLARRWLKRGRVVHGMVADAIASELAEATAFQCHQDVRAWARARGMDVTPRYSPGYCGMSVRQQIPLFAELARARLGVWLTPSCLMLPVKSISGLIGIAPAAAVNPDEYPCSRCDHPQCMQRRSKLDVRAGSCVDWADCGVPPPPQDSG